jgi:hypothetical protein
VWREHRGEGREGATTTGTGPRAGVPRDEMKGDTVAEIQIPGVDFAALAREAIAHQITKAMVGADASVNAIVVAALTRKVDERGGTSQYSSSNTTPYVQWLAEDLIRSAVKQVLVEKIAEMRPRIEAAVAKGLKDSAGSIATGLVDSFVKASSYSHGIVVTIATTSRER